MPEADTFRYAIIGGTTKSGTSSIFSYLSEHPDVCGSSMKETRFFLDQSYPVSRAHHVSEGLHLYNQYFRSCTNRMLRLEATPDYLYSPSTPKRLKAAFQNVRIIFILRNPVDRFLSWFRFSRQHSLIPDSMTVDEFIALQKSTDDNPPQHLLALEQGCYGKYLNNYLNTFDRSQILILYYDDLVSCPLTLMQQTCQFLDIDSRIYNGYEFEIINKTLSLKSPNLYRIYKETGKFMRRYTHNKPVIQRPLRSLRKKLDRFILTPDKRKPESETLSRNCKQILESYYTDDTARLSKLLGESPPWIQSTNIPHEY